MNRSGILKYFVETYFGDDRGLLSETTGYTPAQIDGWLDGPVEPQKRTLEYVIHCALAPEFQIIDEFAPFEPTDKRGELKAQVREILGSHHGKRGIYAPYDATAHLLYIGKTDRGLLDEIYLALKRPLNTNIELKRWNVVKYISAYYVGGTSKFDYPKHVESLILRISTPRLNKNIGQLKSLPK